MKVDKIVLASGSPFRQKLLKDAGLAFTALASDFAEENVQARDPRDLALKRALGKAMSLAGSEKNALIIGADQVLSCEEKVYSKAATAADAEGRLQELSGKTHVLHSALVIVTPEGGGKALWQSVEDAVMTMRPLSQEEIAAYVATGEWRGAVGCYQYENRGGQLLAKVSGTFDTIIGLPLLPLFAALRDLGLNPLTNPKGPWQLAAR